MPPLIVTDFWEDWAISDGNHRQEALLRLGEDKYWVIFCLEDDKNIQTVRDLQEGINYKII